jgi:serine/threonine protein kinase
MNFKQRYSYNVNTDLLGKGGFARVYKAYDQLLERYVAIKVFNVSKENKGSVLKEIRQAIKLIHPNLICYYDVAIMDNENAFGEEEQIEIGVMEYANFGDLKSYVRRNPDFKVLVKLLTDVLQGLSYLHSKGIIHRDLKPQNILLHKDGDLITAKISDFGISKSMNNDSLQSSSALIGTIEYMAPEQFNPQKYGVNGRIDTSVDIWAFGVMIFELLTDRQLFGQRGGDTTAEQIMSRILSTELPEEVDEVPEPYKSVIKKCLVADAKIRLKKCLDLVDLFDIDFANYIPGKDNYGKYNNSGDSETMVMANIKHEENKPAGISEKTEEKVESPPLPKKSKTWIYLVIIFAVVFSSGGVAFYFRETPTLPPEIKRTFTFAEAKAIFDNDPAHGIVLLRNKSTDGSDSATLMLANMFWDKQQFDSAVIFYKSIEKKNFPVVFSRLGQTYYRGLSGNQNYALAEDYFLKAAEMDDDTTACYYLGEIYYKGIGSSDRNYKESFKWFTKGSVAGNVRCKASLALLYFEGKGVDKDMNKAVQLYTDAANAGNSIAKYMLGYFHENGLGGFSKDKKAAISYYQESARDNVMDSKEKLKRLQK